MGFDVGGNQALQKTIWGVAYLPENLSRGRPWDRCFNVAGVRIKTDLGERS